MPALLIYVLAALAEIGGCYALWSWQRSNLSELWLIGGIALLCIFGFLLSLIDSAAAGRSFAIYGAIYIVCSLGWMRWVEKVPLDRWDLAGATLALMGAGIIFWGPR